MCYCNEMEKKKKAVLFFSFEKKRKVAINGLRRSIKFKGKILFFSYVNTPRRKFRDFESGEESIFVFFRAMRFVDVTEEGSFCFVRSADDIKRERT